APGLSARAYFNRYTDDAIDLCNVLSSFAPQAKATLHELCKVMGLSGKPAGIDAGQVARYYLEGRIKEVADYCYFIYGFGCDKTVGEIEVIDCARRNEAKVAFSPKQLGHNLLPQDRKYILVQDCPPAVEWAIRNLPHMLSPHPPTSKLLCFGVIPLIRRAQPIRGC